MRSSKKNNRQRNNRKKDKPPVGREKEFMIYLWLMSHRNEDADRRIFDEWSYHMQQLNTF